MINGQADMKVTAAMGSSDDILLKIKTMKPHVILLDLGLLSENGLSLTGSVKENFPDVRVIGTDLIPTQVDVVQLVQAGVSGFILKDATISDFLGTVRSVARGEKVLPPPLTDSLFSHVAGHVLRKRNGTPNNAVPMTKRESEIIALIAEGMTNKEIASRLNVATSTVKSNVHNILSKMALHTRLQIAKNSHDGTFDLFAMKRH